jgi:hypothetical protein
MRRGISSIAFLQTQGVHVPMIRLTLLKTPLVALSIALLAAPARAHEPAESVASKASAVATTTVRAIERGVTKAADAVEHGVRKAGDAVEHGAKKTGAAVARGAKKTGEAVEHGARKTGEGVQHGAKKTDEAVKRGANAVGLPVTPASAPR